MADVWKTFGFPSVFGGNCPDPRVGVGVLAKCLRSVWKAYVPASLLGARSRLRMIMVMLIIVAPLFATGDQTENRNLERKKERRKDRKKKFSNTVVVCLLPDVFDPADKLHATSVMLSKISVVNLYQQSGCL